MVAVFCRTSLRADAALRNAGMYRGRSSCIEKLTLVLVSQQFGQNYRERFWPTHAIWVLYDTVRPVFKTLSSVCNHDVTDYACTHLLFCSRMCNSSRFVGLFLTVL